MTRVLLIADTERVQRIFLSLAEQGILQLKTASTLALGEFELTSFSPDFTFVQSRISGFSGEILLRHLDKMLPSEGKLVLLAGDSEDAAQARRHGRISLELGSEDALLERSIAALLSGAPLPAPTLPEEPKAARPALSGAKSATSAEAAAGEPELQERVEAGKASQAEQESQPAAAAPLAPVEPEPVPAAVTDRYPAAARAGGKAAASAFEQVMRQAQEKTAPIEAALLEVPDRVEVGKGADKKPAREVLETPAAPDGVKGGGGYFAGETVADALRRAESKKRRNPYLFIVPVLVLVAVPLAAYLAGKSSAPQPTAPALPAPARMAPPPAALPPAAPPAKGPAAPSAQTPPAAAAQPKGERRGAAKGGVESLPPLLEGTKPDAQYGKKHPGWVRYQGLRAEYKLFRENGVYRAIQVIPVAGGTIADDLFKRILRQFGGVDSYRVESTAVKGDYLIEQCSTAGDAALTIYRGKDNKKMKALVVYYR